MWGNGEESVGAATGEESVGAAIAGDDFSVDAVDSSTGEDSSEDLDSTADDDSS